jgi:hypothetical protein
VLKYRDPEPSVKDPAHALHIDTDPALRPEGGLHRDEELRQVGTTDPAGGEERRRARSLVRSWLLGLGPCWRPTLGAALALGLDRLFPATAAPRRLLRRRARYRLGPSTVSMRPRPAAALAADAPATAARGPRCLTELELDRLAEVLDRLP